MSSTTYGQDQVNTTQRAPVELSVGSAPPVLPVHVGWLDAAGEHRRQVLSTVTLRLSRAPMYKDFGYVPARSLNGATTRYSTMFAIQMAAAALVAQSPDNWALLVTSADPHALVNTRTLTATAHKLIVSPITRVRQAPRPATLFMRKGFMESARLGDGKMAGRALMDMVMDALLSGDDIDYGNGWFARVGDFG